MKEENNINVLDELHKGCCMGIDAISFVLNKVDGKEFKELLEKQQEKYEGIAEKIEDLYENYSEKEPHETTTMNKAMTWYGVQMNTINDKSTSKLAELLTQGTNMGIIEGRKLLNHKNVDKKVESLVKKYVNMQEDCIEKLKEFL